MASDERTNPTPVEIKTQAFYDQLPKGEEQWREKPLEYWMIDALMGQARESKRPNFFTNLILDGKFQEAGEIIGITRELFATMLSIQPTPKAYYLFADEVGMGKEAPKDKIAKVTGRNLQTYIAAQEDLPFGEKSTVESVARGLLMSLVRNTHVLMTHEVGSLQDITAAISRRYSRGRGVPYVLPGRQRDSYSPRYGGEEQYGFQSLHRGDGYGRRGK